MTRQVKSKQCVTDRAEAFISECEVKAVCDLVAHECIGIDSRLLAPACGNDYYR